MTHTTRELIGRSAALLLALLLLAGSYGLGKAASWATEEERREHAQRQTMSRFQRRNRIGPLLWLGCGASGLVGAAIVVLSVLPNRVLYKIRLGRPPVLWENPEPGQINRF